MLNKSPWEILGAFLSLSFLIALVLHGQNSGGNCARRSLGPKATSESKLRADLQQTVGKLLATLERGQPQDLLPLCSRFGVVFGVDVPAVPPATIRKEIEQKVGVYCGLFESECLRRENASARAKAGAPPISEPIYSYRDRLLKASAREVKIAISRQGSSWVSDVTVTLKGDVQPHEPIAFEFMCEHGQWKLNAVPFY